MSCESCELLKQHNEQLHGYIQILLTKMCTKDKTITNSTNLQRLDQCIHNNLDKFDKKKSIELMEVKYPAYQSLIFLVEKSLQNHENFLQKVSQRTFKYVDSNNEIIMSTQIQQIIMKEISNYYLPEILKLSDNHAKTFSGLAIDLEDINNYRQIAKDNNRVENIMAFNDPKIQSKIQKDFYKCLQ
jgi:glutamate racemase